MTRDEIVLAEAHAGLKWSAEGGTWSARVTPEQARALLAEHAQLLLSLETRDAAIKKLARHTVISSSGMSGIGDAPLHFGSSSA